MEATGHAGYAEKGKDIVCAGVSALLFTVEDCLNQMYTWDKLVQVPQIQLEPGDVKMECEPTLAAQGEAELLFRFLETGCRLLAEEYPEYIQVATAR